MAFISRLPDWARPDQLPPAPASMSSVLACALKPCLLYVVCFQYFAMAMRRVTNTGNETNSFHTQLLWSQCERVHSECLEPTVVLINVSNSTVSSLDTVWYIPIKSSILKWPLIWPQSLPATIHISNVYVGKILPLGGINILVPHNILTATQSRIPPKCILGNNAIFRIT